MTKRASRYQQDIPIIIALRRWRRAREALGLRANLTERLPKVLSDKRKKWILENV